MKAYRSRSWRVCLLFFVALVGVACAPEQPEGLLPEESTAVPVAASPPPSVTSTSAPTNTVSPTATMPPTAAPTVTAVPETAEVTKLSDLVYATAVDPAAEDQALDIYYMPGATEPKPVVLWAHASNSSRSSGSIIARLLARQGFVVATFDWRDDVTNGNMDQALLREAMENAECVLRYVAAETAAYGGAAPEVIWTGFSAGSWLGGMMALGEGDLQGTLDAYAAAHDGPAQRVACTRDTDPARIVGFVPSAGSYPGDFYLGNGRIPEWTEVFAPVAGYTAVGHNPSLRVRLIHGERDKEHNTDFDDAERFAAALQEAGYDVALLPQPGYHESYQLVIVDEVLALVNER